VQRQFEGREVKKQYLAIVHGNPTEDSGTVEVPLVANKLAPIGQLMYYPGPDGKKALTDWVVVERFSRFALVRFFPYQGRTHQIRLHAL
jgi:tRNA pseudouridine32 synthase/23S rRNA pseudouridine746 synthase